MKKLRKKLERKITDILSSAALYCDGNGFFKNSNRYRIPINQDFLLDIKKEDTFMYNILLEEKLSSRIGTSGICKVIIKFDIYKKDVPFQKAYSILKFYILPSYKGIINMKNLLKKLKNEKG